MNEPVASWGTWADDLYDGFIVVTEQKDSVRSPGWYEAVCHADGRDRCEHWSTTGHEHVVEDAARAHILDRHLEFVDVHLGGGGTRAGVVSFPSVVSDRFADGPHASVSVCGLDPCIDSATSWIRTKLGMAVTPVFRVDVAVVPPSINPDPWHVEPGPAPEPHYDPSGRLGGWLLAEPLIHDHRVVAGRIDANWDGTIHPTLSAGMVAWADAMARGMGDYRLYRVEPTDTTVYPEAYGYRCPRCEGHVDVVDNPVDPSGPRYAWCSGDDDGSHDCAWSGPATDAVAED
jgi:hypothetical protein